MHGAPAADMRISAPAVRPSDQSTTFIFAATLLSHTPPLTPTRAHFSPHLQFRLFMYKAFDRYDQEVVAEAARGQVDDSEEAMQQRMEAAVRRVRATDSGLLAPPTVDKEMEEVREFTAGDRGINDPEANGLS